MRLTDISLNWALPSAVLLVGTLTAVLVMARSRRHGSATEGDAAATASEQQPAPDSFERAQERRRRKETLYATAAYLLLFCCAAVAAALSFHGLVGFGRQNLGLSGGWEYLVPFGLDGAAMFSAVIAVREASHGDASLGSRLLVWIFAGAAAWFNWVHAPRGLGHDGAPQFFAGMSLSAAILFDRALKQTRRAALRDQGLVPRPLPQIRIVRWLRAPRETFGAWSLMLLEGVRTLDEAVDEVRDDRKQREQERLRRKDRERLDRARVKAINRQHRLWSRGRAEPPRPVEAAPHVDVEIASPVSAAGEPGSEGTGANRLTATDAPSAYAPGGRPALQAVVDDGGGAALRRGESTEGAQGAGGTGRDEKSNAASPRLDTLEEKLAEIERQFG
ncbi:DUF2637 domain-containing protein [Streptomyces reniochalinae]|uniref:DUF2637 domain-containing protein n=1 Tax=Streptomyces reniochalinae TaxID=2250578 RepID=A0A367EDS1_9ACTN|nr:DUF2637 domain-containing protein [Streptomyces reniochalinae]RCG15909.1 DUF2637 domain-containing protein [Streptomyces reniochalinae]